MNALLSALLIVAATLSARMELYPKQAEFVRAPQRVCAFVGGRGAGKSESGAWRMIRRSRGGDLWIVTAPTYKMLGDSTIRSFRAVAERTHLLAEPMTSSPPRAVIHSPAGGKAEVIFRSLDDPENARGPSVAGAWMDEASLCSREAYEIVLGCLRHAGRVGDLIATYTPKGRKHWTYGAFATGAPDVFHVSASAWENPFLAPEFVAQMQREYSSQRRAQEIEGQYVEFGGVLFRREMFPRIATDRIPAGLPTRRAWDLAATEPHEGNRDPDWTAGERVSFDRATGKVYWTHGVHIRRGPSAVRDAVFSTARDDGPGVGIRLPQDPGQAGKDQAAEYARILAGYDFRALPWTGEKSLHWDPLIAAAERGDVLIVDGAWTEAALDLIEETGSGHDDAADALALANQDLTGVSPLIGIGATHSHRTPPGGPQRGSRDHWRNIRHA